jgi:hypothetical protein
MVEYIQNSDTHIKIHHSDPKNIHLSMETFEYSYQDFAKERFIRGVSSIQESEDLEEGARART